MKNKINKILVISLFIILIGTKIYATSLGDYDNDEEITSFDAYKTLELSTVDREFTDEEINTLDIDKDGEITSFDAYLILSYSIGIDDNGYWTVAETDPDEEKFNSYYNPVESKFYYNQLNENEKKVYDTLYNNKDELKDGKRYDVADMPYTSSEETNEAIRNVYLAYKYDNPDDFYMVTSNIGIQTNSDKNDKISSVAPELYKNLGDIDISISEFEKARREAIVSLTATNDFEKIFQLHNYLVKHNTYETRVIENPKFETAGTYTAYGALVKGRSVCEGYAMAYKYLLNSVGIECEIIMGETETGSHSWNAVKLDGNWYYVDATWDDPIGIDDPDYVGFTYFLVGSDKLDKDHIAISPTDRFEFPSISKLNYEKII